MTETWITDQIISLADAAEQRLNDENFDRQLLVEYLIDDLRNLAADATR